MESDIYKCETCGYTVLTLAKGFGKMSCCGKPMTKLTPNSTDASQEKHIPVIEKINGGYKILVGSATHPMDEDHFITAIVLKTDDGVYHEKCLSPGDKPELTVLTSAKPLYAGEHCNKHGLWTKNY